MCGIVGGIAQDNIRPLLVGGLARLEYRGYDSAGIAVSDGAVAERRITLGRVSQLRPATADLSGAIGIGHTRWATHGAPTARNAHPIRAGAVLVAHNGIIENHADHRRTLLAAGRQFQGDTDTEIIAHLIDIALQKHGDLQTAWRHTRRQLAGAYAIAVMTDHRRQILAARHGSPLLAGVGPRGVYIASDAQALAGAAEQVHYLENGDYVLLTPNTLALFDQTDASRPPHYHPIDPRAADIQLGEYTHFMQKEIFEQPEAASATLQHMTDGATIPPRRFGAGAARQFRRARHVVIAACGTSHHAGMIAAQWLEQMGIPCRAEIASEYRHRPHPLSENSLLIAVSQSGETADTLSAMRAAAAAGATTLAIVNSDTSAMRREAHHAICTRAGAEIGVASTKAFTAQLTALLLTAAAMARARGRLAAAEQSALLRATKRLPHLIRKALLLEPAIRRWARPLSAATSALYIGRRQCHPLALEGALKLKEISYIHAEGCAAGELKHGSLALVDGNLPVIALAPDDDLLPKTAANLSEIAARDGQLYVLAGQQFAMAGLDESRIIRLDDDQNPHLSPMVYAVALQLLAYHTARHKGTDIDKPRNLAKAVTVE